MADTSSGKDKIQLKFQPLSEGLGFHPFSDGLPYAPVAKSQHSQQQPGAGATSAGRPTFVTPTPIPTPRAYTPGRVSVPVATPAHQTQRQLPTQQFRQPSAPAQQQHQVTAPAAKAQTGMLAGLEPAFGMGYAAKRVLAYLLDSAFNLALCAGALSAALWRQDLSPELLLNPGIVLIASLFLGVFNWAITTAQEVAFGTSVGKRVFGLALSGTTTAIFLRAFFFLPSLCFGGIGVIWALFDRRRRCWHDLVVDLQPIEIARI